MIMLKMLSDMVKDVILHQEATLDLLIEKGIFLEEDLKRLAALKSRRLSQMDQIQSGFQASVDKVLNDPDFDKLSDAELLNKFQEAFPMPGLDSFNKSSNSEDDDSDEELFG